VDTYTGIFIILVFFSSLALGLWAFFSLIIAAISIMVFGADFDLGKVGILLAKITVRSSRSWELSAVPLFLLMGELLFRADLSRRLFDGLSTIFNRIPGGLLHVNVTGCTVFAAVSGSSAATTATVGRISVPELLSRGYSRSLILGSLAGSGSFGLLIPPSIGLIIYGVLGEVSIVRLFAAGFLPGLIVATFYSLYIGFTSPKVDQHANVVGCKALLGLLPIFFLILIVLGSIYCGIASPTEAAAVGVAGALLLAFIEKRLTREFIFESLFAATHLTCVIGAVVITASALSTASGIVGAPQAIASWVVALNLNKTMLLFALALFYILLGLFLDGVSILVLTLPLTMPIAVATGIDPIWFGIFLILMIELGLMTPPVGFNLFVIQSISSASIGEIALAAVPFFLIMCASVILFTVFPEIVLWLPHQLF
jgi:C4-dicarboxylate transporter DctM subunit